MRITIQLTSEQSAALEPLREQVTRAFAAEISGVVMGQATGYRDGPLDKVVFDFIPHDASWELIGVLNRYGLREPSSSGTVRA